MLQGGTGVGLSVGTVRKQGVGQFRDKVRARARGVRLSRDTIEGCGSPNFPAITRTRARGSMLKNVEPGRNGVGLFGHLTGGADLN